MKKNKTVFIGCSSRDTIKNEYKELASNISDQFIKEDYNLASGGASTGMMGKTYQRFNSKQKEIFSYTVEKYQDDLTNLQDSTSFIYKNTFDRTKNLYKKGNIIIFLPGGTGTLAELFACIEENRTTKNPKLLIIYNYNGYFDKVLELIYYCVTNKFNDESIYSFFKVISTHEELINLIKSKELKKQPK